MKASTKIRLQKRIAETGFYSRRKAEQLIIAGRVRVNGELVQELGTRVFPKDHIQVDGKPLHLDEKKISILLNKPAGVLCSRFDPHDENTVMQLLPKKFRHLKPVGRLDKESEGLLILSNDGELIQQLTHPRYEHLKTYHVLVKGKVDEKNLRSPRQGMNLDGTKLNPMDIEILSKKSSETWLKVTLSEGRKRQIRRVMDQVGYPVLYLRRTHIGHLGLGELQKGEHRILKPKDISMALSQ